MFRYMCTVHRLQGEHRANSKDKSNATAKLFFVGASVCSSCTCFETYGYKMNVCTYVCM